MKLYPTTKNSSKDVKCENIAANAILQQALSVASIPTHPSNSTDITPRVVVVVKPSPAPALSPFICTVVDNEVHELITKTGFCDKEVTVELFNRVDGVNQYKFSFKNIDEPIVLAYDANMYLKLLRWLVEDTGIIIRKRKFDPIDAAEAILECMCSFYTCDDRVTIKSVCQEYISKHKEAEHRLGSEKTSEYVQYSSFADRVNSEPYMRLSLIFCSCVQQLNALEQKELIKHREPIDFKLMLEKRFLDNSFTYDIGAVDGVNYAVHASVHKMNDVKGAGNYLKEGKDAANRRANSSGRNYAMKSTIAFSSLTTAIFSCITGKGTSIEHRMVDIEALLKMGPNVLVIFDRGYYATHFIAKLVAYGIKFIIRVKDACNYKVVRITDKNGTEIPVPKKTINSSNKKLTKALANGGRLPNPSVNDPNIQKLLKEYGYLNLYVIAESYTPANEIHDDYLDYYDRPAKADAKNLCCKVPITLRVCARCTEYKSAADNEIKYAYLHLITATEEREFQCDVVCETYCSRWQVEQCIKGLRQGNGFTSTNARKTYFNIITLCFAYIAYSIKSYLLTRTATNTSLMKDVLGFENLENTHICHLHEHALAAQEGLVRGKQQILRNLDFLANRRHGRKSVKTCDATAGTNDFVITKGHDSSEDTKWQLEPKFAKELSNSKSKQLAILDMRQKARAAALTECLVMGEKSEKLILFKQLDEFFKNQGFLSTYASNILKLHNKAVELKLEPSLAFTAPKHIKCISMLNVQRNAQLNKVVAGAISYINYGFSCFDKDRDISEIPDMEKRPFEGAEDIILRFCLEGRLTIQSYEKGCDYRLRYAKLIMMQHRAEMLEYRQIASREVYDRIASAA